MTEFIPNHIDLLTERVYVDGVETKTFFLTKGTGGSERSKGPEKVREELIEVKKHRENIKGAIRLSHVFPGGRNGGAKYEYTWAESVGHVIALIEQLQRRDKHRWFPHWNECFATKEGCEYIPTRFVADIERYYPEGMEASVYRPNAEVLEEIENIFFTVFIIYYGIGESVNNYRPFFTWHESPSKTAKGLQKHSLHLFADVLDKTRGRWIGFKDVKLQTTFWELMNHIWKERDPNLADGHKDIFDLNIYGSGYLRTRGSAKLDEPTRKLRLIRETEKGAMHRNFATVIPQHFHNYHLIQPPEQEKFFEILDDAEEHHEVVLQWAKENHPGARLDWNGKSWSITGPRVCVITGNQHDGNCAFINRTHRGLLYVCLSPSCKQEEGRCPTKLIHTLSATGKKWEHFGQINELKVDKDGASRVVKPAELRNFLSQTLIRDSEGNILIKSFDFNSQTTKWGKITGDADKIRILVENKTKPKSVSLTKFLNDNPTIRGSDYQQFLWKPTSPKQQIQFNPKVFNLYTGMAHKYDENFLVDHNLLDPIFWVIGNCLCNGKMEEFQTLMALCAQIVQQPATLSGVITSICGDHRSGKSWFLSNFFSIYVLGKNLSSRLESKEQLTDKFNSSLMNKLMAVVDEGRSSSRDASRIMETMKAMSTMTTKEYEQKGVDRREEANYSRIFLCSNYDDNISAQNGNTDRLFVLRAAKRKYELEILPRQWLDMTNQLWTVLHDPSYCQRAGFHFFHYLMKYDISWFDRQKIVKTDLSVKLALDSQPVWKFLCHMISEDYSTIESDKETCEFLNNEDKTEEKSFTEETFVRLYYDWRVSIGKSRHTDTLKEAKSQRDALKPSLIEAMAKLGLRFANKKISLSYNSVLQALRCALKKPDFDLVEPQESTLPADFWEKDPHSKVVTGGGIRDNVYNPVWDRFPVFEVPKATDDFDEAQ